MSNTVLYYTRLYYLMWSSSSNFFISLKKYFIIKSDFIECLI